MAWHPRRMDRGRRNRRTINVGYRRHPLYPSSLKIAMVRPPVKKSLSEGGEYSMYEISFGCELSGSESGKWILV